MGRDIIRPEDLGKIFFKLFRDDMEQVFPGIIEEIERINNENINLDVNRIHDELIYLHVFAYYQEITHHFKSHVQRFSEKFHEEFENYLMESMPKEDVVEFLIGLNMILLEYQKQYDEIICNEKNSKAALLKFGSYIARRILGEKYENDIPYSYYMSVVYGSIRKGLTEFIQSSIETED